MMDRQTILDNLSAIETTAKLLVNALTIKQENDDKRTVLIADVHRKELISQTSTFLEQAQKVISNLSNSFNLTTDAFPLKTIEKPNGPDSEQSLETKNGLAEKKIFSLSSITLDEIIQHRLSIKDILPNSSPSITLNLVSLVRSLRSIDNFDALVLHAFTKIFTEDERLYCSYDGLNGKLVYPPMKRFLFNRLLQLFADERHRSMNNDEQRQIYLQCEKAFPTKSSLEIQLEHIESNDEKQWIFHAVQQLFTADDIKRVNRAKQELKTPWNTNEVLIYQVRLVHLHSMKIKWLEQYPTAENDQAEKWSICIDWILDAMGQTNRSNRSSKRKTLDTSNEQKRLKSPTVTIDVKWQEIDRAKCDVYQYAQQLMEIFVQHYQNTLPNLDQLKQIQQLITRFYWTANSQETWSKVLEIIERCSKRENQEIPFRSFYSAYLLEDNAHAQQDIDRLLQIP